MTLRSFLHHHRHLLGLMLLMAATRFHHEGTASLLPDASLAVFFLAGLASIKRWGLVCLLAEAAIIDGIAIQTLGSSDFCLTPAYAFLLPTYLLMVWGGAICKQAQWTRLSGLGQQLTALVTATSGAFLISTTSFYLLSGVYTLLSVNAYLAVFGSDFASYVGITLLYSLVAQACWLLARNLLNLAARQQA